MTQCTRIPTGRNACRTGQNRRWATPEGRTSPTRILPAFVTTDYWPSITRTTRATRSPPAVELGAAAKTT
jgi:hypothetical protein